MEGINPKGLQVPGHRSRAAKWGKTYEGNGRYRHATRESRGREGHRPQVKDVNGGKRRYKWWRLAGGGRRPGGRPIRAWESWGVEDVSTDKSEAPSNGDRLGGGRI